MYSILQKISLKTLLSQPILLDANIFMTGIEKRSNDKNYSFENIKELIIVPVLESFKEILLHKRVYEELDEETRQVIDRYTNKNVKIVEQDDLYEHDPLYTTIFHDISCHELVKYNIGSSKDRGEVYSLTYAAYNKINYFSSRETMVEDVANELEVLKDVEIVTFDIIVLISLIYYNTKNDKSKNKALKSLYKSYGDSVIKRHKLPETLMKYAEACSEYI